MELLKKLDAKLSGVFKDLPPLPDSARETLAQIWPWLALIGGVMQLFAALAVWRLLNWAREVEQFTAYYSRVTGVDYGPSAFDKTMIYVGVAFLVVDAVILLLAFSPLRARDSKGWRLLFLGALLNLAYAVVSIFIDGRGLGSFIVSLVGSAIGFYLLYQVKDKFNGKKPAAAAPAKDKK